MPRIVEFNGQQHEFPDEATDDQIRQALSGGAAPVGGPDLGRALQVGVQGVGRGAANLLGMPGDLANQAADIPLQAADYVSQQFGGPEIPFRFGPSPLGSESIASTTADIIRAVGGEVIDPEDMTTQERAVRNGTAFATEALTGGTALARRAGRVAAERLPVSSTEQALLRPYQQGPSPRRVVAGDTAAGAGAGLGVTAAQENDQGPLMQTLAGLLGGLGGGLAADIPHIASTRARNIGERLTTDKDVPPDANGMRPNKFTSRRAAEFSQQMASDPEAAGATIGSRAAAAREAGDPVATSGLLSDDIGLSSAEQAARLKNRVPFIERDRQLGDAASGRVTDLQDPTADIPRAQEAAVARPGQLMDARDAEAIPLLREAEASGATVDAAPVAALIDEKLRTAKRPAVRNALQDARQQLNVVGGDELDTSVSGLYETRKAISDLIEGRGERPTDRFAKSELIAVRDALDTAITEAEPRFGEYLQKYREGSEPVNSLNDSKSVARLMQDDPRTVAKQLLSGNDYGSAGKMREVTEALGSDPEAQRGWRAAVAEVLSDKVRNTGSDLRAGGKEGRISLANLEKTFKQNEEALSEVFSPSDMESLRRAHEVLAPLKNREIQATTGSATAENQALRGAWDALGTAMTFKFGAVHAGMIMFRLKKMMNLAPGMENLTTDNKAMALVSRMWFDPDLAKHLLETPVDDVRGPTWNRQLGRLLGVQAGISAGDRQEEQPDEVMDAVTGGSDGR